MSIAVKLSQALRQVIQQRAVARFEHVAPAPAGGVGGVGGTPPAQRGR